MKNKLRKEKIRTTHHPSFELNPYAYICDRVLTFNMIDNAKKENISSCNNKLHTEKHSNAEVFVNFQSAATKRI